MRFPPDDLRFLRDLTRDVVEASRVKPKERVGNSPPNKSGETLIRPGGRDCYPAMWVRDFVMSLDSGLITDAEMMHHLHWILMYQNGAKERKLKSGGIIPPHAIPDHINFGGGPVFYPGAYSSGDDQGGEPFGILPPADDHFDLIHLAYRMSVRNGPEPFIRAFEAVPADPATGGMVTTTKENRFVGFGFCDTIYLTGALLYPSLLRRRAAFELSNLIPDRKGEFRRIAESIQSHLVPIFSDPDQKHGWLFAATDIGRQPDVWGTCYALAYNALPDDFAQRARETVADAVNRGTISRHGAVRHVPTDFDASPTSMWQQTSPTVPINTYQNGAYWHTPTGWLIAALLPDHEKLARQIFDEYIAHLRQDDFRKGPEFGAPWECFYTDHHARQNPVYMCSVTTPLGMIERLQK